MIRSTKLWSLIFCISLLVPGYALGAATFYVEHPQFATVGQIFEVKISLGIDSPSNVEPLLQKVCAYNYCLLYDDDVVSMWNLPGGAPEIPCCEPGTPGCADLNCKISAESCITLPPVNGGFFQPWPRTCEATTYCTAPDNPQAFNCCQACSLPQCSPGLTNILFSDVAGLDDTVQPVTYPCGVDVSSLINRKPVSTLTFQAHTPGCFTFTQNPQCLSSVGDCESGNETIAVIENIPPGQICILEKPKVPMFSSFGIALFAIFIVGVFLLINKRLIRMFMILLACIGLVCGILYSESAHSQQCPTECTQYNLDVNHNGFVTATDAFLVLKCAKTNCTDLLMDFNGDRRIDMTDYQIIAACIKMGCCKMDQ